MIGPQLQMKLDDYYRERHILDDVIRDPVARGYFDNTCEALDELERLAHGQASDLRDRADEIKALRDERNTARRELRTLRNALAKLIRAGGEQ